MNDTCRSVSSTDSTKPPKLDRFINSQPGNNRPYSHDNNCRIGDALCRIVFSLGRFCFPDTKIMQQYLPGLFIGVTVRNKPSPFARKNSVNDIGKPVQKK